MLLGRVRIAKISKENVMKKTLPIILVFSGSIFASLCSSLSTKWPAIEQTAENCRIIQNVLIAVGSTEVALSATSYIDYDLIAIITAMHIAKFPALVVEAIREKDFSLLGEVSDSVALFGLSGFFAELLSQNQSSHDIAYMLSILLGNGAVTLIFNILNHTLKQHYPSATDQIKRRVMRALFVTVGNILIPLLFGIVAHADRIDFNVGRVRDMIMLLFLTNTLGHVIAEVAGYVVAHYLPDGSAADLKEGAL